MWFSPAANPEDREKVARFLVGLGNAVLAGDVRTVTAFVETRHHVVSLSEASSYEIGVHFHMKKLPEFPEPKKEDDPRAH